MTVILYGPVVLHRTDNIFTQKIAQAEFGIIIIYQRLSMFTLLVLARDQSQLGGYCLTLTISVRQAAVAAQRTMTFQYDRPLERHS